MPEFPSVQVCSELKLLERVFKKRQSWDKKVIKCSLLVAAASGYIRVMTMTFWKCWRLLMGCAGVEGHMHFLFLFLYIDIHSKPVIFWTIHQQKSAGMFLTLPEEIHFLFMRLPLHQHAQAPVLLVTPSIISELQLSTAPANCWCEAQASLETGQYNGSCASL